MLPVYISYFAGDAGLNDSGHGNPKYTVLLHAAGFVLGFTAVFTLLGAAAGTFGVFLKQYHTAFNIIGGLLLILFGLNYMEAVKIGFLNRIVRLNAGSLFSPRRLKFIRSILFGFIFAIGWTPCIGAFLGSALLLAANSHETVKGIFMLLVFSIGLGIPFIISAVLIDRLKESFSMIKRHYKIINFISGLLLIIVGIFMMTGSLNAFLALFTLR